MAQVVIADQRCMHCAVMPSAHTDLELHFPPVLVKLLLELVGLPEVARQLAAHDDQPEADEHDDTDQDYGVDQPGQHCVHKPVASGAAW